MEQAYNQPEDSEFQPSKERFIPLVDILEDPRLTDTEKAQYENLIRMTKGNVYIRETIPTDPDIAPTKEIYIGYLDS